MNQRDARSRGYWDAYGAGEYAASDLPPDCTEDDAWEAFSQWDDGFRQYSPFEFFASDVNHHGEWDADALWDAYSEGQSAGFKAGWKKVRPWPGTQAAEKYARRALREAGAEV